MIEGIGYHVPAAFSGVVRHWRMDQIESLDVGLGLAPSFRDEVSGEHLQAESGTILLTEGAPGLRGCAFGGALRLYNPNIVTAPTTGPMAVGVVLIPGDRSNTDRTVAIQDIIGLVGTVTNSSAHNYQWALRLRDDITRPQGIHESGAGTDREFSETTSVVFPQSLVHIWLARDNTNAYSIWINGRLSVNSPSAALTVADGGGSARIRVGGHGSGINWFRGFMASLLVKSGTSGASDAAIAYAQTVGTVYPRVV